MSIADLLNEQTDFEALNLTNESLLDTADMAIDALEEGLGFEEPTIASDVESYQFHNQDHLNGMSDEDIENLNPDNTDHLNNHGVGSGKFVTPVTEGTILENLLSDEGTDDVEEDDLEDGDLEDGGLEDDLEDDLNI